MGRRVGLERRRFLTRRGSLGSCHPSQASLTPSANLATTGILRENAAVARIIARHRTNMSCDGIEHHIRRQKSFNRIAPEPGWNCGAPQRQAVAMGLPINSAEILTSSFTPQLTRDRAAVSTRWLSRSKRRSIRLAHDLSDRVSGCPNSVETGRYRGFKTSDPGQESGQQSVVLSVNCVDGTDRRS